MEGSSRTFEISGGKAGPKGGGQEAKKEASAEVVAGVSGRRGVEGGAGGGHTVPAMAWVWVCSRSEVPSGPRLPPQGQGTGWGEAQGQQPCSRGSRLKISRDVRVSWLQEVGKNDECQEEDEEEAKGRRQSQLKAASKLVYFLLSGLKSLRLLLPGLG